MQRLYRLIQILVATLPFLTGLFAVLNNVDNFEATFKHIITPLLSMQGVSDTHAVAMRSMTNPEFILIAFVGMATLEGLVGLFSFISIFMMLKNINRDKERFQGSKSLVLIATLLGFVIWGVGFFCIGGDYFLSWKNPALNGFQQGAAFYAILMALAHLLIRAKV